MINSSKSTALSGFAYVHDYFIHLDFLACIQNCLMHLEWAANACQAHTIGI